MSMPISKKTADREIYLLYQPPHQYSCRLPSASPAPGEIFSVMIAEKPHTQPDLSGEDPTLWHSWSPPFQA